MTPITPERLAEIEGIAMEEQYEGYSIVPLSSREVFSLCAALREALRQRDEALALVDSMRDGLVKCANLTRHQECSPNTVAQVGAMVTNIVQQLVAEKHA